MPAMLLHIDGSQQRRFSKNRPCDLLVILDEGTSQREVIEILRTPHASMSVR